MHGDPEGCAVQQASVRPLRGEVGMEQVGSAEERGHQDPIKSIMAQGAAQLMLRWQLLIP